MSPKNYKEYSDEHPEEFASKSWVEDEAFLSQVGIEIPNKSKLPKGFVKYLPQDFIVEEITQDKTQLSINKQTSDIAHSEDQGATVFATLVKCNITTFEAIRLLAEALDCEESQIQYAGIKDQRAITAQRISIRKVPKTVIEHVSIDSLFLKDICVSKGALQPGLLWGNRFTILVRTESSIHQPETIELLANQFEQVLRNGFYNFFYLQRFSSPRYINYKWGRDIILGNFESAVKSVITETTPTEATFYTKTREKLGQLWGDWGAMQTLVAESVPTDIFMHERQIIDYLVETPDDFLGALKLMPQQVQLWVYAFSSRLHNQELSFLLRTNRQLPEKLPVVLSSRPEDTKRYRFLLEQAAAWPPKWPSLREFPAILRRSQSIRTQSQVQVHAVDVVDAGVVLQFSLQKGEYATTFLSHLFTLIGGDLDASQVEMSTEDQASLPSDTRDYFKTILEDV